MNSKYEMVSHLSNLAPYQYHLLQSVYEAQFPKLSVFIGQISVFRRCCIENVKDRILIQVYNIINESVNHSSKFISVKGKKNLRKSQAQFREMLRKLRLRQNNDFLIRKKCVSNS